MSARSSGLNWPERCRSACTMAATSSGRREGWFQAKGTMPTGMASSWPELMMTVSSAFATEATQNRNRANSLRTSMATYVSGISVFQVFRIELQLQSAEITVKFDRIVRHAESSGFLHRYHGGTVEAGSAAAFDHIHVIQLPSG